MQVDQVLVVGLLDARQMGIYAVALAVSRVPQLLHAAVVAVVFPSAAGLDKDRIAHMVGRAARISTAIALAFGVVLAAAMPFLIPGMYGRVFAPAVPVALVLTLEALIGGLVSVLAQAFMASDRPALVTLLQTVGLAVTLPSMFVLLPHFGLVGAAAALLLSTVTRLGLLLFAFPAVLKVRIPRLVLDLDDVRALLDALPTGVA
jgi:O-antigen/teichoic acid export membrane protein